MNAHYKLIHFEPDPFLGMRFPIGAIIRNSEGDLQIAKVEKLPSASCLGNRTLAIVVQRLYSRLDQICSANTLPPAFGPYTTLSDPKEIPGAVGDALEWVEGLLNRRGQDSASLITPRGVQRSTLGYRFFQTWHVDKYVKKTFNPQRDSKGWLKKHAPALQSVTHWVPSQSHVLLMEPIVPNRKQFSQDVKEVAQRFIAYRYAMDHANDDEAGSLLAYMTTGAHPDQHAEFKEVLSPLAHSLFDTAQPQERDSFLATITHHGQINSNQPSLLS